MKRADRNLKYFAGALCSTGAVAQFSVGGEAMIRCVTLAELVSGVCGAGGRTVWFNVQFTGMLQCIASALGRLIHQELT